MEQPQPRPSEVHLIGLNGPPGCGKTTVGFEMARALGATVIRPGDHLKRAAHRLFGLSDPPLAHESDKDVPTASLDGRTWRYVYQRLSEGFFKPLFGADYFGRLAAKEIRQAVREGQRRFIVEFGFEVELQAIAHGIAPWAPGGRIADHEPCRLLLVRLHRHGRDFRYDTRDYLRDWPYGVFVPGTADRAFDVTNDGTVEETVAAILAEYRQRMGP